MQVIEVLVDENLRGLFLCARFVVLVESIGENSNRAPHSVLPDGAHAPEWRIMIHGSTIEGMRCHADAPLACMSTHSVTTKSMA
jgi:hypothetical protein